MTYLTKQQVEEMFDALEGEEIKAFSRDDWEKTKSFIHSIREKDLEEVREYITTLIPPIKISRTRTIQEMAVASAYTQLLSHLDTLKK